MKLPGTTLAEIKEGKVEPLQNESAADKRRRDWKLEDNGPTVGCNKGDAFPRRADLK